LAVEVVSPTDSSEAAWQQKLARYRKSGINEIVRFDPESAGRPLRLWDRFDGDLVERDLDGEHALLCDALGVHWSVQSDPTLGRVLRLSQDAIGQALVPSAIEREQATLEREQATLERERAALERIAELEAELRRR